MELQVDFYADTFRSGIINVPDELMKYGEKERRSYIRQKLASWLEENIGGNWHSTEYERISGREKVQIIICKRKSILKERSHD